MEKRLYRDGQHKVIGGVCAGLAEYFNTDVSIIRIIFVGSLIFKGGGSILYIILWIVLPKRPYGAVTPGVDYVVQPEGTTTYVADQPRRPSSDSRIIAGFILIAIGVLYLLNAYHLIPDFSFEYFWSMLLIVVGLVLVFNSRHRTPAPTTDNTFDQHPPKF